MKVPFLDLEAQYNKIKPEVLKAIEDVLDTRQFIQGSICEDFSKKFLEIHGGNYGVGCSNGTSAITISLRALDIKPGDEVITVANTFFATVEAIAEVGATPILVDCLPDTYGIDTEQIKAKINSKTKAIIPVHLYGNPAQMDEIMKIAEDNNLKVIEDCAQAHLASLNGQAVATFGDAGTFSFYPGKNLGAYGDAGFVLTKDEELQTLVTMHLNHGRIKKYEHDFLAGNYRMDGIQAAVLGVKLKYISDWTEKRITVAKKYDEVLKAKGFKVTEVKENAKCSYHLYVVEVSNRKEVMSALKEVNIGTGVHYPIPMHMQPACSHLGYKKGDFPVSEAAAERIVSLPICPELTDEQIQYVLDNFLKVAKA
ncbi:MAG: DegT/DnrJ/EryC1/StrS family aminotransferase [Bdellovibrionota bacterium]|nr:DegT/DnrJ/EryC1/StrS family aminotransferase [Bdellovibrionota bacterium]